MSDAVLIALIGAAGTIVGSVTTVIVTRMKMARSDRPDPGEKAETTPVQDLAIDLRELRILRALYGEPTGRRLEQYRIKWYVRSLYEVVKKGWVKLAGGKYSMTPVGAEFCRKYLEELATWQPPKPANG